MTTAAIVNAAGEVHRLITVAGRLEPARAATGPKIVTVRPVQAQVHHLPACRHCWPAPAEYDRWVHGAAA